MPRLFSRILLFKIDGEIYDLSTKPESIIRNYTFTCKDPNDGKDHLLLECSHKDNRGRINRITRLPEIRRWKIPDTEFFMKL